MENAELVRLFWDDLNRGQMNWLSLCDERMEIHNPDGFPLRGPFHGHEGARQWAKEVWEVFSDLHHELEEVIEAQDGETVVSVQRSVGRMRHTGIAMDQRWAGVWTLRDGKAMRVKGYLTRAAALEAAGLAAV